MSLVAQYVEGDLPCAIMKNESLGTLCGYVGVPPCHPWYGTEGPDDVEVHGGITWHAHEQRSHPTEIAYLQRKADEFDQSPVTSLPNFYRRRLDEAKKGEATSGYPCDTGEDVWWIGFDCGHYEDLVPGPDNPPPGTEGLYPLGGGEGLYRDEAYVRQEITGLVSQACEAMNVKGRTARRRR